MPTYARRQIVVEDRSAFITASPDASVGPSMVLHDNLGSRVSENRSPHSNSLSCFRTFLLSRTK